MKLLAVALVVVSQSAFAFLPAPGLWNTETIDGQGFNIETQNNIMIVTSYVFDQSGKQIWYLSAGTYDEHTRTFTATFANATGGSCLSCPYSAPGKNGSAGGNMQIVFDTRESGTIYYPGGSRKIAHLNFGYSGGRTGYFYGEWQFSQISSGLVDAQWVVFPGTTYTGSDGTVYASGYEDSRANTTAALGTYDVQTGLYIVAIDDGTGFVASYAFSGDQQRMLGLGYVTPSGVTPTGNGSVASGNRLLTQFELANPGDALALPDSYANIEAAIQDVRDSHE